MSRARQGNAGFSLLEVLVTVALVGVALTVLSGVQRTQMRSLARLRTHAEARLLLEQAVERFQYGDGVAADTLIAGEFAEYHMAVVDLAETAQADARPAAPPGDPEAEQRFLLDVPEFGKRRIEIAWAERESERSLSMEAWRFEPAENFPGDASGEIEGNGSAGETSGNTSEPSGESSGENEGTQ